MTAIYQSSFLIALGWTIAASIWQSALLWMIYQAICSINRSISPARKHSAAFLLLLGSFGWFCITLVANYSEAIKLNTQLTGLTKSTTAGAPVAYSPDILFSYNGLTDLANQYLPYISAAYLVVLLLLLVKLINAYLYSKQLKTKGLLQIDEYWITLVNNYAQKIGIVKHVQIHLSQYISVPATLNFFKPVILLPLAAFNRLTTQQVESVILHELAHIKRNDYLINIIVSVIETVLFFNPFVHLLGKALKKEREHCCDDFVLQHRFDPHSYASALLSLEQLRMGIQPMAMAATGKNSHQLLGRIKRIMNVSTTHFNYGQKLFALVLMASIMIFMAWLSPPSSPNNGTTMAEEVSNDEVRLKDRHPGVAPYITINRTTHSSKRVKEIAGANHKKNNKAASPFLKNQNDLPALAVKSLPLPIPANPPLPPVAPPPPPPAKENKPGITTSPSSTELNQYFSLYFTNNDAKWNTQEWLNAYLNQKDQLNNQISLNDLTLLMDASQIKLLHKHADFLFFNPPKKNLPDIKKIFTEQKLKLDSIRKASVELAEKQKEIWLEQIKEKSTTVENEAPVVYEIIVHIDNSRPLQRTRVKRLQQNASVILPSKMAVSEGKKNNTAFRKGVSAFTIAERRQRMVVSL